MDSGVRRAVIVDGKIRDKKDFPDSQEIVELSALLETIRNEKGVKSIHRSTTNLLEHAIRENDATSWRSLIDDINTKDFDGHAARVILEQHDILPALFITCITQVKDSEKMIHMIRVFLEIVPHLNESTMILFSKAVSVQWKPLIDTLVVTTTIANRDIKESIYECLSRFVNSFDIQKESIVSCIKEIINLRKYEVLSVFSRISSKIYASDVLPDLIQAAKLSTATNRYAVVSLIAKIISENDEKVNTDFIKVVLDKTILDKFVDRRTVRALAFIIQKVSDDPILRNFATCVSWI